MHGAGNDYIYVMQDDVAEVDLPGLARAVSHRHKGIGSDGLVVIGRTEAPQTFTMRMFNADGSEAGMCGNASRCIAKYVYERGLTDRTELTLLTASGAKRLRLHVTDGCVRSVTVDMGAPSLDAALIPAALDGPLPLTADLDAAGFSSRVTAVGMGNPHGIVFLDADPDDATVAQLGPALETHAVWPERANIEFVHVIDTGKVRARVWERGSGETQACGTGACAVCVASALTGRTGREIDVELPGGTLHVEWRERDGHVLLTGPAEWVCEGQFVYH